MSDKIIRVDIDRLEIKDQLHRTKLDIKGLSESIAESGQLNPLIVRPPVNGKYRVFAGRRRLSALQLIQIETGKKQKALVVVKDIDKLHEELITIDENIQRQQLSDAELDEALYRRKQIYVELHPETKQHTAGGVARGKAQAEKPKPFTKDAAQKLGVAKRTVEKAIQRAEKATPAVKEARAKGQLSPSKVDFLVQLKPEDQDKMLPLIKDRDVAETKKLIARAKVVGAYGVGLDLRDEGPRDDQKLRRIARETVMLTELIGEATKSRRIFESREKMARVRELEQLAERIQKFVGLQRAFLGERVAIRRSKDGQTKVIKASFRG